MGLHAANRAGGGRKWSWWWVLAGGVLAAVVLWVWQPAERRGPMVGGLDIGPWLREVQSTNTVEREQAYANLRSLGTNALPVLRKLAARRDPRSDALRQWIAPRLSPGGQRWLERRWPMGQVMIARQRAVLALSALELGEVERVEVWGALLRHPDPYVANLAWAELRKCGASSIEAWRAALLDRQVHVRILGMSGMVGLRDAAAPALPELRRALKDSEVQVRMLAVLVLGEIGPAGWPDLVEVARRGDEAMRTNAIRMIVISRSAVRSNAVPVLAWAGDESMPVRRAAMEGLRWLRPWTPQVVSVLELGCRAPDPWVRQSALELIGGVRDPAALQLRGVVESCLTDGSLEVRVAATNALRALERFPLDTPGRGSKTAPHALDLPPPGSPPALHAIPGGHP